MVDLQERVEEIRELVDEGDYFTINRARQYGKTTTLNALAKRLSEDYLVVSLDFQAFDTAKFADANVFSLAFAECFLQELESGEKYCSDELHTLQESLKQVVLDRKKDFTLYELFRYLTAICDNVSKPVVLLIDEADSALNNQVFLDFLGQLRLCYLDRDKKGIAAFQSVILAGVYDVKNMKRKISSSQIHSTNSPWNIAADFDINMSFTKSEIAGMLQEYERDTQTGMNIEEMAELLYDYTSGYPFLVSRLCKLMDEKVSNLAEYGDKAAAWTKRGFLEAERMILIEKNTLFESLVGKLTDYTELNTMLYALLFTGKSIVYNADNQAIDIAAMFGFIKNQDGVVAIANRIFETRLYNFYLSTSQMRDTDIYTASLQDKSQFIKNGQLDMRRILEKFALHFNELYADRTESFVEDEGRKYFLLYLKPIINGTGNYYIESRTRSMGRTDVIVDYRGVQYIIEMKIWRGQEYKERGERQLVGYLDDYHTDIGYMVSFNFNRNKQVGVKEITVDGKRLIEAII